MGSLPGRKNGYWGTPEGWFFKAIINVLWKSTSNHGEANMGRLFFALIPHDVCAHFVMKSHPDKPVTPHLVYDRGHKGTLPENAFEHPDKHPKGIQFMEEAKRVVFENKLLTMEDVIQTVNKVKSKPLATITEQAAPIIPEAEKSTHQGYLYVLEASGSPNCAIGHSGKPNDRVSQHSKGDINGTMRIHAVLLCDKVKQVEQYLKQKFKDDRIISETSKGSEKFKVQPQLMVQIAENYCNRSGIMHTHIARETYLI